MSRVSEAIQQDFFNLCNGIGLLHKNVHGDVVTIDNIKFYLWRTKKSKKYTILDPRNPTKLINKKAQYVFFVHGWLENVNTSWYNNLKHSFFEINPELYVIQVDWSEYAGKDYIIASYDTREVGRSSLKLTIKFSNSKHHSR